MGERLAQDVLLTNKWADVSFDVEGNVWYLYVLCLLCWLRNYARHSLKIYACQRFMVDGGWGLSKGVATFSHVGGFFNLVMATTAGVSIIPSFRIWGYVLYVEHISCVITNCGQHQWAIPSPFSIALEALLEENTARKLLSISLDLFFKILLFQVTFLIFFSILVFSPYILLVGLLLQYVALFRSRELVKV